MYSAHTLIVNPLLNVAGGDITIWRYLDLWKFASLLEKRALFFSRLDHLDDPFEGDYSTATYMQPPTDYSGWPSDLRTIHESSIPSDLSHAAEAQREELYVNCWHMNDFESDAMWRLYVHDGAGIAIRSTVRRLQRCFHPAPGTQHLGRVVYLDYERDLIPVPAREAPFWPALCKRVTYEGERECRALVHEPRPSALYDRVGDKGIHVPCDLSALIAGLYVAPAAKTACMETVNDLLSRAGLLIVGNVSTLAADAPRKRSICP
jgi:hypothetical protein